MANLLQKASIVLTPTAYDNSKVLCVKPSDGSGDFDFSRNSAATRVNAQGLVENVQILSSNLVQNGDFSEEGAEQIINGDFATDSGWGKVNATISGGKGNLNGTGVVSLLFQNILTNGKTYTSTFTISNYNGLGGADVIDSSGASIYTITSNGTFTFTFTHSDANGNIFFRGRNGAIFSIDNVSVKEVAQDWTLGTGWSVDQTNSKATCDGTQTSTSTLQTTQVISNIQNDLVKLSFEIKDYSAGAISVTLQGTGGIEFNNLAANGVYEINVTVIDANSKLLFNANSSFVGSIANVSVIRITDDTNLPRINYEGFSYQDALGNELIDYSTFTSPSASWSLVGGLWVFDDTANGYLTTPSIAVVVGDTYKVVVDVTIASGNANFRYASSNNQTRLFNFTDFVDGLNTFTATVEGVDGILSRLFAPASLTDNPFTLNSISIKKINGQEVVPDSGCGSWLFEPQSTNLLPYSSDFSQWDLVRSTSTANALISPSGETNANKLQANTTGASGSWYREVISAFSNSHIFSVFAKSGSTDFMQLRIDGIGGVVYDLSNGTVKSQASAVGSVEDYGNGWYRCSIQATASSSTAVMILVGNVNMTTVNWFATSGDNIYVWGAQLEALSYASSLIPTSGSSVTRNQDVCNNGGSLPTITSTEGVLYAQIAALANSGTFRYISLFGDTSNHVQIYYKDSANKIAGLVRASGNVSFFFTHTLTDATNFVKVAIKFKQNDFALWVNGIEVATDTSGNTPIGLSELDFDYNGGNKFFGKTKALAVWKEALTDSELQSLTTI